MGGYNYIMRNPVDTIKKLISNFAAWFGGLSIKKKIIFIIVFLVAAAVVSGQISKLNQPPAYTTQKVTRSDITEFVTETGNITSGSVLNVFSPATGVITDVFVSNGQNVSQNQDLFRVESAATQQEIQQAYANYLAAQQALNAANSTQDTLRADMYARWKTFRDMATNSTYENSDDSPNTENRKAAEFQIAQDEWHAAEKRYKDQQTAIAQANAAVGSTYLLYQATQNSTVKAPGNGVVSNLSISNGSSVTANSALAPQNPVLSLTRGTAKEVVIPLSETDIAKVKPGQQVKITVDAVSNKTYKGVVERVDSIGVKIQGVVTYNVYIRILNDDDNLRAGMSVDAEITTKKLTSVLSVPNSAVKPYQGGRAVRVQGKNKSEVVYVPVEVGVKGLERTQILKGLTDGQTIIVTLANEQIKRPGLFGR